MDGFGVDLFITPAVFSFFASVFRGSLFGSGNGFFIGVVDDSPVRTCLLLITVPPGNLAGYFYSVIDPSEKET